MLRQGNVKLIGEPFPELQLGPNPGGPTDRGAAAGPPAAAARGLLSQLLVDALAHQDAPLAAVPPGRPNPAFARIYGFSFEGHYYDLPRPVIMLVTGPGVALGAAPPTILESDEAARLWEFSRSLRQWNYDKKDMSIRLDLTSGTLEDIILARTLADRAGGYGAAVSGAAVSGAGAYGAGAYGAGAYGAGAYGAGAFGAGAFGAGAFGRGRRGGGD
jgi:hypothetical protein